MVRSFTVAFTVVGAGGDCLDKPSSDCFGKPEDGCKAAHHANVATCMWDGFNCMNKPSTECDSNITAQYGCTHVNFADKCLWFGGNCLDKPSSDCFGKPEDGCNANTCMWFVAGEAKCDYDGYVDLHGNACAHYANNKENCKHSDASQPGKDQITPCEACCACRGCPAPKCTAHSCPKGHIARSNETSCGAYGDACTDDTCCWKKQGWNDKIPVNASNNKTTGDDASDDNSSDDACVAAISVSAAVAFSARMAFFN